MPPASMATSQSATSPPVPTAAILSPSTMMVSPAATGEAMLPERNFPDIEDRELHNRRSFAAAFNTRYCRKHCQTARRSR